MKLLDWLERRFSRYAIPNLPLILVFGQMVLYAAVMGQYLRGEGTPLFERTALIPAKVLDGEVWRVITYLIQPFNLHPLFIIFSWYLFYLWGSALESIWGTFRFNLFLLVGFVASVAASFLRPEMAATNAYLYGTVFLAFARFYPDFIINIFFILPIKIKWLAFFTWLGYAMAFAGGEYVDQVLILASIANYILFFWRDHLNKVRDHRRRLDFATKVQKTKAIVHQCAVCGRSSKDEPRTQFRYCSKCSGQKCYCPDHIRDHEHVLEAAESSKQS